MKYFRIVLIILLLANAIMMYFNLTRIEGLENRLQKLRDDCPEQVNQS